MTSAEIISSIQNWEAIRDNSVTINNFFLKGNCFMYDLPAYAVSSSSLHAYPGIYNDQLYFFVIPAEYDKEEYAATIYKYTEPCLLQFVLGDNRLTPQEAKGREKAWNDNHEAWVTAQVGSAYGIFEAFVIPTEDCEIENVIMNLALKVNTAASGGFEADLIVTNDEGKQIVYDDFSKPVPPYSAAASQESFYLLSANI